MRRAILALLLTAIAAVACGGEPDRPALMPVPGTVAFTIGVDLWLREDGEERLLVEPGEGRQVLAPALSPDGERIAFVRFQLTGGVDLSVGADLMIVDANGAVSTVIEHDQQAEYFWYPAGAQMAARSSTRTRRPTSRSRSSVLISRRAP